MKGSAVRVRASAWEEALPAARGGLARSSGRLLSAFLVLHRARPVRRDELVAALWPERPPAAPDDALVSRLRKVLGEDVLRDSRHVDRFAQ